MHDRKPLTLNLSQREMASLESLSKKKSMSKSALVRQALRLYQVIEARLAVGEKLIIENEQARHRSEMMVL